MINWPVFIAIQLPFQWNSLIINKMKQIECNEEIKLPLNHHAEKNTVHDAS